LKDGQTKVYQDREILHPRLLSVDGVTGLSPISQAMQAIGLGLAAEEYGGRFFGDGCTPPAVLQTDNGLSDKAMKRLDASIKEQVAGLNNSRQFLVLEEGLKWTPISIKPDEAQFLETRKFQVSEIAGRIYGVPGFMVGAEEKSTSWGSSIEQQMMGFRTFTLEDLLVEIEDELTRSLLTPEEKKEYFFEFDMEGLLRADTKTRAEFYRILREISMLTANEGRERENFEPSDQEGANVLHRPANWVPLDSAPQPAPFPPQEPENETEPEPIPDEEPEDEDGEETEPALAVPKPGNGRLKGLIL